MGRILFFALIALFFFWVIRAYLRDIKKRQQELHNQSQLIEGEDMVRCVYCGVHLPKGESLTSEGKFYCSEEHRRLHLQS
jgi:uncharacterized protein